MIPLFVSKHDHLPSSRPSICHHCNIDTKPQSDQYSSCIFSVVHSSHFDAFSTKRLVKRPKHFNFMISCCVFFHSLSLSFVSEIANDLSGCIACVFIFGHQFSRSCVYVKNITNYKSRHKMLI